MSIVCYTHTQLSFLVHTFSNQLVEAWKTPFEAPNVIFADDKLAQWFTLDWLKHTPHKILAGLKSTTFLKFFFETLNVEHQYALATPNILEYSVILALKDVYANVPEIQTYLCVNNQLDETHLVDLACRLSQLFIQYENDAPLAQTDIFKAFGNSERAQWQKTVYQRAFEHLKDFHSPAQKPFITLRQLYLQNKDRVTPTDVPLFIFDAKPDSTIETELIEWYAKNHNVHIYTQHIKSVNDAIQHWNTCPTPSWLNHAQNLTESNDAQPPALHALHAALLGSSTKFDSHPLKLVSAMSKRREIEALHTALCQYFSQEHKKVSDVVVFCPNIDDYRTEIHEVFDQNKFFVEHKRANATNGINKPFHLRYSIADTTPKESLTYRALDDLLTIAECGVTRSTFFSLVHNPLIQKIRDIRPEEVNAWLDWVDRMNVFRQRGPKANRTDWQDAQTRLLFARLTNDEIQPDQTSVNTHAVLMPFHDINTADDKSLAKFYSAIQSLENLVMGTHNVYQLKNMEAFAQTCEDWLFLANPPKGYVSETIIYRSVVVELQNLMHTTNLELHVFGLRKRLLTAAEGTEFSNGNLFVNGVTFMNFSPTRQLPIKHAYFIGLNAQTYPGRATQSSLDLRQRSESESPVAQNRNAFLRQLLNTSDSLYLSYLANDIKRDAKQYPSSLLTDLDLVFDHTLLQNTQNVSLDETRETSELYTNAEMRAKRLKQAFGNHNAVESNSPTVDVDTQDQVPKNNNRLPIQVVSLYDIECFLKNPFEFQVNRVFGKNEAEDDDEAKTSDFEPIELNAIKHSTILKNLAKIHLGMPVDGKLYDQYSNDIDNMNEYFADLKKQQSIPDQLFCPYLKNLQTLAIQIPSGTRSEDHTLSLSDETSNWMIKGTIDFANDGNIFSLKSVNAPKPHHYLKGYVTALIKLASDETNDNNIKSVNSVLICNNPKGPVPQITMTLTPNEARERLTNILKAMYTQKEQRILAFDHLFKAYSSKDDYLEKVTGEHGDLQYFKYKDLFNYRDVCGFNEEDFLSGEWSNACHNHVEQYMPELKRIFEDKSQSQDS